MRFSISSVGGRDLGPTRLKPLWTTPWGWLERQAQAATRPGRRLLTGRCPPPGVVDA